MNEDALNFVLELTSWEGLPPAAEQNLSGHKEHAARVASSPFGKWHNHQKPTSVYTSFQNLSGKQLFVPTHNSNRRSYSQ